MNEKWLHNSVLKTNQILGFFKRIHSLQRQMAETTEKIWGRTWIGTLSTICRTVLMGFYFQSLSKCHCLQAEVINEFGELIITEITGLWVCSLVSVLQTPCLSLFSRLQAGSALHWLSGKSSGRGGRCGMYLLGACAKVWWVPLGHQSLNLSTHLKKCSHQTLIWIVSRIWECLPSFFCIA